MQSKRLDKFSVILWFILIFAMILRLYYILTTKFPHLVYDAKYYDQMARQFLHNGILGFNSRKPNAYITPGFPLFLTIIYRLFGSSLIYVRVMNVLMSVCIICIVYKLSEKYLRRGYCLFAALIMAVYPPFIYSNGLILTEVLFTFLFYLFLYLFVKGMGYKENIKHLVISGVIFGLGVMVKPTALLLIVPFFIYHLITKRDKLVVVKMAVAFLIPVCLVVSLWIVRNYRIYNTLVMTTSSAHPLLWGTHPYAFTFDQVVHSYNKIPVDTKELKRDELWKSLAIKNIKAGLKNNPITYIKWYIFGKTNHLWFSPWIEYPDSMKFLGFLRLPLHWFIVIFGLIGFFLSSFKDKNGINMLGIIPVYFTLVHIVVLAIPRYLYPSLPAMVILALYAFQSLEMVLGSRRRRRIYAGS